MPNIFGGATRYDLNAGERKRRKAEEAAARQRARDTQASKVMSGNTQGSSILSGTEAEQKGQLAGLTTGAIGYGQGLGETGQDIQRVKELQSQRTAQSGMDPVSAAIMGQKAGAVAGAQRNLAASGVKGGVAAGAIDAVSRQRDSDIAASLYGQQRQSIADERSLASNMLAGTTGLMYGEKAANVKQPSLPAQGGMSVICTELYCQGIMDLNTYEKDCQYGRLLAVHSPHVIIGYHVWAKPIVKLMQKSKLFTKIVAYPAMKWANHIAGNKKSIIGYLAVKIGQPICGIIGKLKTQSMGEKYV